MDHPDVNFVIAHGSCPWFLDAAEVIYKNAHVWTDLSGIFVRLDDLEWRALRTDNARVLFCW